MDRRGEPDSGVRVEVARGGARLAVDRAGEASWRRGATLRAVGLETVAAVAVEVHPLDSADGRAALAPPTGAVAVSLSVPAPGPDRALVLLVEEGGAFRWVVPAAQTARRPRGESARTRFDVEFAGAGGGARRGLHVLAFERVDEVAGRVDDQYVRRWEARRRPPRLRAFTPHDWRDHAAPSLDGDALRALTEGPALLLLHGPNVLTDGDFAALPAPVVRTLHDRYAGRVLAFDHPSLSVDPVENCRQLLALLPPDVELDVDVLAHSRGGLVARVLAERPPQLDVDCSRVRIRQVVFVGTPNRGTPLATPTRLGDLLDALTNLRGGIPEDPAGADGEAAAVIDALSGIVAVVKQLAVGASSGLDGLVAMRPPTTDPDSFLATLNRPRACEARYRAVSADYAPPAGSGLAHFTRDAIADRLFGWEANDLLVPTRSVYGWNGATGFPIAARLVLPASRNVDHGSFWSAVEVTDRLDTWLTGPEEPAIDVAPVAAGRVGGRAGVVGGSDEPDPLADVDERLAAGDVDGLREAIGALPPRHLRQLEDEVGELALDRFARGAGGPKVGRVVVLPGIMGSHLAARDSPTDVDLIWINPLRLVNGELVRLRHPARDPITAFGLHRTYLPLVIGLDRTWDVVPFAFDWRLGLAAAADALAALLDGLGGPAHLVAHSMGGLVCRVLRARHRAVWDRLAAAERPAAGGRLVMLGTPNLGSLSIVTALTAEDKLVRWLARADLRNDIDGVQQIIASFPGVYQLLPTDDEGAPLYRPASWRDGQVVGALLAEARLTGDELAADGFDAERMIYVAGAGYRTAAAIQIDGPGRFRFLVTDAGDGRVTHASGLGRRPGQPDALTKVWYARADHGGLVRDRAVVAAVGDLLRDGTTDRLPTEPPAGDRAIEPAGVLVTGADLDPPPLVHSGLDLTVTRGGDAQATLRLARDIVGEATRTWLGSAPVAPPPAPALAVHVLHASLEHAHHAVVVGHYAGTPLGGAEARADVLLRGRLSARQVFGRYPAQPNDVLRAAPTVPGESGGFAGVMVVGLGEMGDLTPTTLTQAMRNAALEWALGSAPPSGDTTGAVVLGLSAVLMGSYGPDALQIGTVVGALVEGVLLANRELAQVESGRSVRIDELELVELYGQRAEEAARVVADLERYVPSIARAGAMLQGAPQLTVGEGGRPSTPSAAYALGMWRRLIVSVPGRDDAARERAWSGRVPLEFTSLGVRARADLLTHVVDNRLLGRMIGDAVGSSRVDGAVNVALFELLLPNDVKRELATIENLVLVVDEHTATLPWEALADRGAVGGVEPLVNRIGLVRQLRLDERRPVSASSRRPRALVIGDPPVGSPFRRLPAARHEAGVVAEQLDAAGLTVDTLIFGADEAPGPRTASTIVGQLLSDDYQIVHIAAHGWYEPRSADGEAWGGVVIGPGQYLSAVEINQMRRPPELVFLNCCHLAAVDGAVTGTDGTGSDDTDIDDGLAFQRRVRPQLAASVSRALMEMGVRAVVAAGWAVDDRAAAVFAAELYARMLDGESFGPAVRAARIAAHRSDGGLSNTWAAYQCYGDPGFRIATSSRPRAAALAAVSADELIQAVEALAVAAGDAGADIEQISAELRRRAEQAAAAWGGRGDLRAALARAFAECGDFAEAVRQYRAALRATTGDVPITVLEQLANLEMRLGAKLGRDGTVEIDGATVTADELIESARARAAVLDKLPPTPERRAIIASVWKAVAARSSGAARREATRSAARAYFAVWELDGQPYGANNALQLDGTGGLLTKRQRERLLAAISDPGLAVPGPNLWSRVAPADLALTRALVDGSIVDLRVGTALYDRYGWAFDARSTWRERSSIVRHLDELAALQRDADVCQALRGLSARLASWTGTTAAVGGRGAPSRP